MWKSPFSIPYATDFARRTFSLCLEVLRVSQYLPVGLCCCALFLVSYGLCCPFRWVSGGVSWVGREYEKKRTNRERMRKDIQKLWALNNNEQHQVPASGPRSAIAITQESFSAMIINVAQHAISMCVPCSAPEGTLHHSIYLFYSY